MEIALINYQRLRFEIQDLIVNAQQNLTEMLNKQKIHTSWNIGKMVDGYLRDVGQVAGEENLFKKLERDISIRQRALYEMHAFFKAYSQMPNENVGLNWSHYKMLAAVSDVGQRKYLENLVVENALSVSQLRQTIKEAAVRPSAKHNAKGVDNAAPLSVKRGILFTYKTHTFPHSNKKMVDCGFNIFRECAMDVPDGVVVQSVKKNGIYSFSHYAKQSEKLHTYKAYLQRVVDGDTVRVVLDLGFQTHHAEILRLSGINAPERKTQAGLRSKKALEDLLKDAPFLIIKTNQKDIYGRYIADVFFSDEGEWDAQKVADEGCYVSQKMLDLGMAQRY